jgi:hypothetical protein
VTCLNCGSAQPDGLAACSTCGAPLPAPIAPSPARAIFQYTVLPLLVASAVMCAMWLICATWLR